MLQFIKQNKSLSYWITSGIYGLYGVVRSFNGHHEHPHDVFGNKIARSLLNGVFYTVYAPFYQLKLINRIDIKLTGKDPTKYKDSYEDEFSYNPNIFIWIIQ